MKAKTKLKKKLEELWSKDWDLIRLTTKNSDDYDEKYMIYDIWYMTKFINSDDELPQNKTIEVLRW